MAYKARHRDPLFDSDTQARVETYFTAWHLVRPLSDPLAGAQAFDNEMDYFVGGRYLDRCRQTWMSCRRRSASPAATWPTDTPPAARTRSS